MKATLIFDSVNDLLYSKWDNHFLERMKSFNGQENDGVTDNNSVSQLLAPIIASQRVMAAQFGNTYSSIQCKDNTTIVFDEWLDHVFMIICELSVDDAHRELLDCKTFVQHICGQNINLLHSPVYQEWLTVLLESRDKGDSIPGANGIIGESGATAAALNALKAASKNVKISHQHYHLMLFVGDKLLALYSSKGSEDLTPPDLILLSIQCIAAQEYWQDFEGSDNDVSEINRLPWLSTENSAIINLSAGPSNYPCSPHSMHIGEVAPRISFVIVVDIDLREVGIATHMSSQILSNLRRLLLQRNFELLPNALDNLEAALKKGGDALRKVRRSALGGGLATRMGELRRACGGEGPMGAEPAAHALHVTLGEVVDLLKPDIPSLDVNPPLTNLRTLLAPYVDFLRVKALRYFSLASGDTDASCSLTLHKYVEEFPGLVHFVYVDRASGRFLAPDMADCADMLSPATVRAIVGRWLRMSREGYGAATWRSGALHACGVSWWERRGAPVPPAHPPHPAAVRALPPPGDIHGAFYRELVELAFPQDSNGVCLKELVCIHLGLLPASTAVQQARRLAHSVHELAGDNPALASDLL